MVETTMGGTGWSSCAGFFIGPWADAVIGLFAMGAVLGSSAWIVGAGLVAGVSVAIRLLRGEFMSVAMRVRLQRPLRAQGTVSLKALPPPRW